MTDGIFAPEGTGWSDARYAVQLNGTGSANSLTIDLGALYYIFGLKVQADDNDVYRVDYSPDNTSWTQLWDVPSAAGGGLRTRTSPLIAGVGARYVRLYPLAGDNSYAVAEMMISGIIK